MADIISVLYVDDDALMHEPFKMFLEMDSAMGVTTVHSPVAALELMKDTQFDAIISDYEMPEMDGITFLKKLRGSGDDVPFILFTGRGREEVVIDALNNGADHYMQKGGDPTSQFAMLAHMVRTSVQSRSQSRTLSALRERLESFVLNTSDAIAIYDLDFNIVSVNPAYERMYGWTQGELAGGKARHVPAEDTVRREGILKQVASSGEATKFVAKRIRKDGRKLDVDITVSPIRDGNGKISAYASISKDISELMRVVETVTQIKEEFRSILLAIGDAVISTDMEGKIVYLNPAAEEMTGVALELAAGKDVNDVVCLINEESRKRVEIPSGKVIREGKIVGLTNHSVIISSTGAEYMVADFASPLRNELGEVIGTVVVFRDVTKERLSHRRISALQSVSEVLRKSGSNSAVMEKMVGAVCTELMYDCGIVWAVDTNQRLLRLESLWSRGNVSVTSLRSFVEGKTFLLGEDIPGDVWNGAKTIWNANLQHVGGNDIMANARRDSFRSLFACPLFDGDALVRGVLVLLSRSKKDPDPRVISTLGEIGHLAGRFLAAASPGFVSGG